MRAYVGLGGNLGDVRAAFAGAEAALAALPWVLATRRSSVRVTAPVGPVQDQPDFLNAVLELTLAEGWPGPAVLMAELLRIEALAGRARDVPQGPRTLDLDLLVVDGVESDDPMVTLPHPRLAGRLFALEPLAELAGDDYLVGGARLGDLIQGAYSRSMR